MKRKTLKTPTTNEMIDIFVGGIFWCLSIFLWMATPLMMFLFPLFYPVWVPALLGIIGSLRAMAERCREWLDPKWMMKRIDEFNKRRLGYRVISEFPIEGGGFLFPSHPHGIFTVTTIMFYAHLWTRGPPKRVAGAVAPTMLWFPGINILMAMASIYTVAKENFVERLKAVVEKKQSLVWLPGGFEDVVNMEYPTDTVSVPRGWVKYALQEGCQVVPTFHYGEHQTYSLVNLPFLEKRRAYSKKWQVPLVLPWFRGVLGSPVPSFPNAPVTVTGTPIQFSKIDSPTREDVVQWHYKYCQALMKLVKKHRHAAGYPDASVQVVELM